MTESVIQVENLSKLYRLGIISSKTIVQDFSRLWSKIFRSENPDFKIGELNDRNIKSSGEYIWALKDVSFTVKEGELLAIIGKNGAGKST